MFIKKAIILTLCMLSFSQSAFSFTIINKTNSKKIIHIQRNCNTAKNFQKSLCLYKKVDYKVKIKAKSSRTINLKKCKKLLCMIRKDTNRIFSKVFATDASFPSIDNNCSLIIHKPMPVFNYWSNPNYLLDKEQGCTLIISKQR